MDRRQSERAMPTGGVSGGQVSAPNKPDCQAMKPPRRWGWEPAGGSEQDSDLFRMDCRGERRCKAGTQAEVGVWKVVENSPWRKGRCGAVTSPLLTLEPDPLPAALGRGRVPGPIPAVRICPRPLARWGRSLNKHLLLSLQFPVSPPCSPLRSFRVSVGPYCPPVVTNRLHRSSVPLPSVLGKT